MPDFLGPYPASFPYNSNGDRIAVVVEMKAPGWVSQGCITMDVWGGTQPAPSGVLGGMDTGCFLLDPSLMTDPFAANPCPSPPCGCGGVGCGELYGLLPVGGCSGGAIGAAGCLGVGKFIVIDLNGTGEITACLKVIEIIYTEDDWDGTTGDGLATCPVEFGIDFSWPLGNNVSGFFIDNTATQQCTCGNSPPACSCGIAGQGAWYSPCPCEVPYVDLQNQSFGSNVQPVVSIHSDCSSCINAIPWCTDPLAYNYIGTLSSPGPCSDNYATCDPNLATCTTNCCCPNVTNNSICVYPGCPDTSACNYDSLNNEGCIVNGIFVPGDKSCCEYCACWDSNVCTTLNSGPATPWPAGTIGCVVNYTQDCTGTIISPPGGTNSSQLVPPNPNCGYTGGDGCFRIGCTDLDAQNYDATADGCYFPGTPTSPLTNTSGGQYDCCQYAGCDDPTADNYNESCPPTPYNVLTVKGKDVDMPCPGGDNCTYTNVECMDRGCCTDGGSCGTVGTLVSAQCPSGLELCPNSVGVSLCSNYPPGCTPGVDCVSAIDYDPTANQQCTPITSCCTYEGGYVCELDPVTSTHSCIDIYASAEVQPYNWLDPDLFGPCTDAASCSTALSDCNTYCATAALEECAVFLNDYNGNVYSYDPDVDPDNMDFLFKDEQFDETFNRDTFFGGDVAQAWGTASWDIANTADFLWLYACKVVDQDPMSGTYGQIKESNYPSGCTPGLDCAPLGIIREYAIDLTANPLTVGGSPVPLTNPPFVRDIDITELCQGGYDSHSGIPTIDLTIGNGLVAKDDTTLISSGEKVLQIDITTSSPSIGVGITQELFMLPNPAFPSVDGATQQQGKSTGDILVDPLTGNLIITYFDMFPSNGKMGRFENNNIGAIMDHSTSSPSNWSETQVTQNPTLDNLFGLFKWNGNWYGSNSLSNLPNDACGATVHAITDINLLQIDTSTHGTLTTLGCGNGDYNPIQGASQQDGCTDIEDTYCCTDPLALNFVSLDCIDDGSCIYPTEGRKDCLPRLTKEEFLMNVCQKPETRSDVFIERGKVSVFERPQRLSQITTIGELDIHGYGYYNILIQD